MQIIVPCTFDYNQSAIPWNEIMLSILKWCYPILQGPNGLYDPWDSGKLTNRAAKNCWLTDIDGDLHATDCGLNLPNTLCIYNIEYLDELFTRGAMVEDIVTLKLSNNTKIQTILSIG